MQPRPRRFLARQSEHSLQPQRARAVLLARYVPHRTEPHHERLAGVLENGARSRRRLASATAALEQRVTHHHRLRAIALRAAEAIRPSQVHEVSPAVLCGAESPLELANSTRIVFHTENLYVVAS